MLVFYIRHNWNHSDFAALNPRLFAERKIAVHYQEAAEPFNRDHYHSSSAKTAIDYINRASAQETLIVAAYAGIDKILIGLSCPGSKGVEECQGNQLKVVQLRKVREVSRHEFLLPFVVPPPHAAFVRWHMGERAVLRFYRNERDAIGLDMLLPWHLELLCEEWLRKQQRLHRKLFHTGKTMQDFDIVGLDPQGEYLIAQVKHKASAAAVHDFFSKAAPFFDHDAARLRRGALFFAGHAPQDAEPGQIIPIEKVIAEFERDEPGYLAALYGSHQPGTAPRT